MAVYKLVRTETGLSVLHSSEIAWFTFREVELEIGEDAPVSHLAEALSWLLVSAPPRIVRSSILLLYLAAYIGSIH